MVSEEQFFNHILTKDMVLILIVVEYGLGVVKLFARCRVGRTVLILIVVEYGLGGYCG